MKYARLTKEQFEALHTEFARFLATQSITADEWVQLKATKPEVAEQELDVFSDLIWEKVLAKAEFLENCAAQQLFLFKIEADVMRLIVVKVEDPTIDITSQAGFAWLQKHITSDAVTLFTATKTYTNERNSAIFELIQQGAEISDGSLYNLFLNFIDA